MTSPTTIKRLRELLEKATPSPWHVMADGFTAHKSPPTIYHAGDELNYVAKCADFATIAPTRNLENAELIVEMRNALPALLDRVEAMEKREAKLRELLKECADELEAEIVNRNPVRAGEQEIVKRRREHDLSIVHAARKALGDTQ